MLADMKITKLENVAEALADGMRQLAMSPVITYWEVRKHPNSPPIAMFFRREWADDFKALNLAEGIVLSRKWCITPG